MQNYKKNWIIAAIQIGALGHHGCWTGAARLRRTDLGVRGRGRVLRALRRFRGCGRLGLSGVAGLAAMPFCIGTFFGMSLVRGSAGEMAITRNQLWGKAEKITRDGFDYRTSRRGIYGHGS